MTEEKSLIEYPSIFPIKVMGKSHPDYLPAILHIAHQFDPVFDESKVEQRPSKDGGDNVFITQWSVWFYKAL